MYKLIYDIAERCWESAHDRGLDVSLQGCADATRGELAEYWAATDQQREIANPAATLAVAGSFTDPKEFAAYYDGHIHNTRTDELADILIVAATWVWAAKRDAGEKFDPSRNVNALFASGSVWFICSQITGGEDVEYLRETVNLKMRYNEVRED